MPFQSTAQQRFAFGTKQPWAKRWAKETDFSKIPKRVRKKMQQHKDAGTMPGAMLSGPGGLLATPGMGGRKWGNRRKDAGCTCGVNVATKEQLAPGVTRIRGNLCNVHGRYGPCDAAQSGKRKPKAPKGRKPKKPVLTPEQRAQERATQQAANRAAVDKELGITEDTAGALDDLRAGKAVTDDGGLVKLGLAEQAADGSYRLTPAGRALAAARAAGDAGRARDIMSAASDRSAARNERQAAAAERKRAAEERRAAAEKKRAEAAKKKPKGGGSSGGSKQSTPRADREAERQADRARRQREHEQDRAQRQREHAEDRAQRQRDRMNDDLQRRESQRATSANTTTERVPTHTTRVDMPKRRSGPRKRQTTKAVNFVQVLPLDPLPSSTLTVGSTDRERGWNVAHQVIARWEDGQWHTTKAETYGGVKRSKLDDSVFAGPDRSFPIKTAQDVRNAVQSLGRTKHDKAAVKRGIIRRARAIGAIDALPDSWKEKSERTVFGDGTAVATPAVVREKSSPALTDSISASFAVFKDDTDAWRWVARTTTAYRDRDGEIITTKALEQDAQRMTQTRQYGPLRYWHIGDPDPFDPLEPWGHGLDIGTCDYSIVIGRTSIESGTFKSHAIGKAFAENAGDYELSPGFFHPPNQPNAAGEYDNIRRFERSVVPVKYGRASNLFTGMTVKEHGMDNQTYEARVKAFLADMNSKGVPEQVAATALAGMERADKSAQAQGIAFKSDDKPIVLNLTIDPSMSAEGVAAVVQTAMKAMAPASMEEAADTEMEDALEEQADEGDPEAGDMGGEYIGDMSPDEFKAFLLDALAPVLKMQDMVKAMTDMHGELKTMYGGAATKSDEQDAAHLKEIASLKAEQQKLAARLAELTGDQPTVTVPADVEAALKSDGPKAPQHPAVPQFDASRPFQGWAAQTWPQLYDANTQQNRS